MPLYETRKVLRVGERSYAISIPKEWAKRLKIKPGDLLELVLKDNGIIEVRPIDNSGDNARRYKTIVLENMEDGVLTEFIEAAYTIGVSRIKIKGCKKRHVKDLSSRYPGIVAGVNNGSVIVSIALSSNLIDWRDIYHDTVLLLREYYDTIEHIIETGDPKGIEHANRLIMDIEKNSLVLARICNTSTTHRNGTNQMMIPVLVRNTLLLAKILYRLVTDSNGDKAPEQVSFFIKRLDKVVFDSATSISTNEIMRASKLKKIISELKDILEDIPVEYRGHLAAAYILADELVRLVITFCIGEIEELKQPR